MRIIPRKHQARNTNSPRLQEDYTAQVSEEIDGRVTKKLFQELIRIESHFLGALSKQYEFLPKPAAQARCGPVPETFRSSKKDNQGTNKDRSQNDPHPEVGVSMSQSSQEFSPSETFYNYIPSIWKYGRKIIHSERVSLKCNEQIQQNFVNLCKHLSKLKITWQHACCFAIFKVIVEETAFDHKFSNCEWQMPWSHDFYWPFLNETQKFLYQQNWFACQLQVLMISKHSLFWLSYLKTSQESFLISE